MNYVAKARAALNMTQQEMGEALGLSQPSISRLEKEGDEELSAGDRLKIRGLLAEKKVKVPE